MHHRYDVIVVATGGAGLMAALYAAKGGASVACISKLYPTRSHTGAAQGGIGAVMQHDAMRLVFDQDRGMGCHRVRSRLVQRGQVQIDLMGGFDQMARQ